MSQECGPPMFYARISYRNGKWAELHVEAETLEEARASARKHFGTVIDRESEDLIRRLRRWPWRRDLTLAS